MRITSRSINAIQPFTFNCRNVIFLLLSPRHCTTTWVIDFFCWQRLMRILSFFLRMKCQRETFIIWYWWKAWFSTYFILFFIHTYTERPLKIVIWSEMNEGGELASLTIDGSGGENSSIHSLSTQIHWDQW